METNLKDNLFENIFELNCYLKNKLSEDPSSESPTFQILRLLNHIQQSQRITPSDLAHKMHTKESAISRWIKTLITNGLVIKNISSHDKRNCYLKLSQEGQFFLDQHNINNQIKIASILKLLNQEDIQTLENLKKIINKIKNPLEDHI